MNWDYKGREADARVERLGIPGHNVLHSNFLQEVFPSTVLQALGHNLSKSFGT